MFTKQNGIQEFRFPALESHGIKFFGYEMSWKIIVKSANKGKLLSNWSPRGRSRGRVQRVCTPPKMKPSSSYSLLKFVYLTGQWCHSLEVHPLLRKILDPPLKEFLESWHTTSTSNADNLVYSQDNPAFFLTKPRELIP